MSSFCLSKLPTVVSPSFNLSLWVGSSDDPCPHPSGATQRQQPFWVDPLEAFLPLWSHLDQVPSSGEKRTWPGWWGWGVGGGRWLWRPEGQDSEPSGRPPHPSQSRLGL